MRSRHIAPVGLVAAALAWCLPAAALGQSAGSGAVDLELLLAVDASGSVDAREFELQRQGLAQAFRDPEVVAALAAYAPAGVAVGLMQWSGRGQQVMVVDWTPVHDAASAERLSAAIAGAGRSILGETAIADALAYAIDQLERNRYTGARRVIDLSGDGVSNAGGAPDPLRDAAVTLGITINGLAILNEAPVLDFYYTEHVIGGPGAFIAVAKDYQDFARAVRRKLLREIEGAGLAGLEAARHRLAAVARSGAPR